MKNQFFGFFVKYFFEKMIAGGWGRFLPPPPLSEKKVLELFFIAYFFF